MKNLVLLFFIISTFSSCVSSNKIRPLNVIINTYNENTILVDGRKPTKKGNKYTLKDNTTPKQITVKREGYKNEYAAVISQSKITVGSDMVIIPKRKKGAKEIRLNQVKVDLGKDDVKYRTFFGYSQYLRRKDKKEAESLELNENIKIENTIFSSLLNDLLRDNDYIDTTLNVLKNSYLNNLLISASVESYTIHHIIQNGSIFYVDLKMKWELLDYYEKEIYTQKTNTVSGHFALKRSSNKVNKSITLAIKDAMEFGLIEFISSGDVERQLENRSEAQAEASLPMLYLPKASSYVSTVNEAVQSSVTISSKDGHGSGFIVSSEGHILTNYHVISNKKELKVLLHDGKEYDMEVVRISKLYDMALVKIAEKGFKPFRISNSKNIEIASDVIAIGTPSAEDLPQTVSGGIISGVRLADSGIKMIQTDASINSGNSGGVLTNKQGVVLGVVSSKLVGYGIEGVAFAIPAYEIADKLKVEVK